MLNLSRILIVILLSCFLISLFLGAVNFSFAQQPLPTETSKTDDTNTKEDAVTSTGRFGLEAVEGTPKGALVDVFIKIANWIMGIIGVVLVAMLIYGGIMYMFAGVSAGKEKTVSQGKQIITYAIIGIVIIFAAYIIARFVIQAVG
ncbi:MAG: pilin [Patescibacteria group bacterium]